MTTQGIDRAGGGSDGGGGGGRTLRSFLESDGAQAKLAEVATKYMKPSDLVRLTLVAASRQPDLLRCSQTSILRALMDAATMGIMPGGTMGRGYLVPRKNKVNGALEACFDPGYRGLIDIARRSGKVKKLDAKAVWAGDHFEYEEGTNQRVHHVPNLEAGERGEVVAAYAIAKLEDGEPQIEVLTRADIDKIRNSSAAKNAGAWTGWFEEMARKSAVRRLCKYLPYDPVLERAMELADAADVGPSTASITDVRQIAARSSSSLNDLEEQLRRRQAGDALDLGGGGSVDDPVPPPIDDDGEGSAALAPSATAPANGTAPGAPTAAQAPASTSPATSQPAASRERRARATAAAAAPAQPPVAPGPPKGGAAQQTDLLGGAAQPTATPQPPVTTAPVAQPTPAATTMEEDRKKRIDEQNELIGRLDLKPGDAVTVTTAGGKIKTHVKNYARIFGDDAVTEVTDIDGKVTLAMITKGHE